MSAAIPSAYAHPSDLIPLALTILDDHGEHIHVNITRDGKGEQINVARADFLAAVSSELGVVIIDKADLPIVTDRGVDGTLFVADDERYVHGADPARYRAKALEQLALADYLEAHPPVDEAQVSALAEIVRAATDTPANAYIGADLTAEGIARRLVATGKVEVRS